MKLIYDFRMFRFKYFNIVVIIVIVAFFCLNSIYLHRIQSERHGHVSPDGYLRGKQSTALGPPTSSSDAGIQLIEKVCITIPEGKYSEWTRPPIFYLAAPLRLSYCVVPHEFDTIWRQIFNVLRNINNTTSNVSQFLGQYDRPFKLKEKVPFKNRLRKDSDTIIFIQNPYVRLFSAYHNKFFIDHRSCEYFTFQEFLDKVISGVKLKLQWGTVMNSPLVPKCKLCDIKTFEIIKEETFIPDIRRLFKRLNLSSNITDSVLEVLEKPSLYIPAVLHSMVQLQFLEACTLGPTLVSRFWQSLQNMGVVSKTLPFPASLKGDDVMKNITGLVEAAVGAQKMVPLSREESEKQKREALVQAYAGIKDETIEYIQEIFQYEFDMFGYNNKRPT